MDELEDLLDRPSGERLDIEYKDWLDLADEVMRAKVARTIGALANFGGGYLVFGIDDKTGSPTGVNPYSRGYSQDDIHAIIRKYLDPMVQIAVRTVRDNLVLIVPSHGAVPICSKKNGPGGKDGRPQEIVQAVHYTRKVGPESAPISTEAEWLPVIRRCVMQERSSLTCAPSSLHF